MTLKKYVIVYFIILLLNLAVVNVVIAQENESTVFPSPSSTVGKSNPSTTTIPPSEPSVESGPEACLNVDACKNANETLGLCNGIIKPPSQYIEEGIRNGTYGPDQGLNKCMCNRPYYDDLSACIQCFANATNDEFGVYPLEEYKKKCKDLGTTYTETMPNLPPKGSSAIPRKIRIGIVIGVAVVVTSLVGIAILRYTRKKRRVAEESAFASKLSAEIRESGNRLSTGDILTTSYPPPKSPSTHYPPPPTSGAYQSYASPPPPSAPSEMSIANLPTPQSTTPYYPPPGEYRSPRGGQGGESDSYFDGKI